MSCKRMGAIVTFFFFQAEDGIRDLYVTGVQTCALPISLDRAAKAGVIVCQGTRVGSGRTLRSPGLRRCGWVASDNLQPWKARLLLALALDRTSDPDEIQSYFDTY